MDDLSPLLSKLTSGASLTRAEAKSAFGSIMSGESEPLQVAAMLTSMSQRGETIEEIVAGAEVMRSHAIHIQAPDDAVDTCGTGGSGIDSFNISTAAAFITVAAGIPVAKHGNRAASSKSGSADVLEALGGNIDLPMEQVQKSLTETGFTFLFARAHHSAVRHVVPVRAALKFKTIFNVLGPLSSPANAKRQVLGVYDRRLVLPLAEVLRDLGSVHSWVVHGSDGLDEITTTGPTFVAELRDGAIREFEVSPGQVGFNTVSLDEIRGGTADHNAAAIRAMFAGEHSPFREITLMNAGASLLVGGKANSFEDAVQMAAEMVDGGLAHKALNSWVEFTKNART
ncbi:MAG: anthranilate phosphoribosyltransferase [Kordiimonadaceae bacterium]|nr:anthranilate phosphoribosyltransferase [Kordiimonadaceae bacterium]MBO6570317.1 anthranilate phosphoribosyltransferase [Kordiimonadaceae bacterium]MBO6965585.1 anthranilate phosphoribosyltransferase [Kordiimonadaceae bacterium]